jgi:hypothetical protein
MAQRRDDDTDPKKTSGHDSISDQVAARARELKVRYAEPARKLKARYDRTPWWRFAVTTVLLIAFAELLRRLTGDSAFVSILTSLTLVTVCLLVFKLGPLLRGELARATRGMWLPIAVTAIAGVLLFYEGQGEDLGVGLLGEGQPKLIMLAVILFYWAVNNWHSARMGLNYEFPNPTGNERWLFWPPRLLGVCAHLFAALSLALAGWNVVTASGESSILTPSAFLVFVAPLTIGLVTFAVWAYDAAYLSTSRKKALKTTNASLIVIGTAFAIPVLFGALWLLKTSGAVPEGLFAGTFWISLSAIAFLYFVSKLRSTFDPTPENHDLLTVVLTFPAIALGAIAFRKPNLVGDLLGSLNVCFFAFGAVLATINGIGWVGKFIVNMNERVERFKFAGGCIAFLLLLAALTSLMRDFHRVRLCADKDCVPAPAQAWSPIPTVNDRPTIREAALAWYKQAEELYHKDNNNQQKPVPMLVIATAGGGIRAAYWTATVLEKLKDDLQKKGRALDKLLFAISGVSGGSVGAMNYVATLHFGGKPTAYLQSDFLAPAIASLVFADSVSNFLPDLGQVDRGTALEQSFEDGSSGHLGHSFLSFFPNKSNLSKSWRPALLLNATHQETGRRVIASNLKIEKNTFLDSFDELQLLNSDMRASTVAHNSARFTYVSPAGKLVPKSGPDLPSEVTNRGYVIDGGYFENYGALTALELARSARDEIETMGGSVKLVILQISSDPTLTKARTRVRTIERGGNCVLSTASAPASSSGKDNYLSFVDAGIDRVTHRWNKNDGEGWVISYLNELAAPLIGVTRVREAHGTLAAAELASAVCVERDKVTDAQSSDKRQPSAIKDLLRAGPTSETPHFAHLAMCEVSESTKAPIVPPLGWALSKPMRDKFSEIFYDCGNQAELAGLEMALE